MQRSLAAILAADVVGYSRLMGRDGAGTLAELQQFAERFEADIWDQYASATLVDLVVEEGFPLTDLQVEYPKGHQKEFFGEKVFMIEGKSEITASALVPDSLPTGGHLLALKVTAQACDDKVCLAPTRIPVVLTLMVP